MSPTTIGFIGIGVLLVLLFSRMPIGFVMGVVGLLGFSCLKGIDAGFALLDTIPYRTAASYVLCTLPMFILMGQFAFHSEMSGELYDAMRNWLGRFPGGLAMATIGGCAVFSATSGSSMATSATMGSVALPHMKRYRYDSALATGSIASGGTFGILIPPSMGFILYGVVTEESIGKLFMAGILPGLLLTLLFLLTIFVLTKMNPQLGPPGPSSTFKEKALSLKGIWPFVLLFILVIGGIYGGIFTSTEAGALGAAGALLIGVVRRRLTLKDFVACVLETGKVTAMIFLVLIGAMIFSTFLSVSTIPMELANMISAIQVSRFVILLFILLFYIILGALMDIISGLLLTLPVLFPVVINLGYDAIWFGVIIVLMFEIGLVTPPIGLNVFVLKGVAPDIPLYVIFKGIIPFFLAMLCCVGILILFPRIATFLPGIM